MFKKIIIITSILLISLIAFMSCSQKENKLYVGTNAEFEPFEYRDGDNIVGFDIDLINEIAKIIKQDIEVVDMAFDGLLPALQSKKIDLYTQSMAKTSTKMQENIKDRDKLKASLEKANAKYDEAVRLYGKESEEAKSAKEAVDKLNKEYNNKQKAIESNAKQIQNYENELNKANTELIILL